jgi:UDP-N-acetyl-2-amino-2-deoxyglucuronate dehydrogenase
LCEKPLEITLERCDEMIAVCQQQQVQLGCIFQHRTSTAVQVIKQAVEAQRFGTLTVCHALIPWYRTQAYYDSGAWRGTWALDGGGALMNQGIHTIDLLQWLAGPVKAVHAFAGTLAHARIEVEDTAVAIVQFQSGALGTIVGTTTIWPGYPLEVHIAGNRGSAALCGSQLAHWQFVETQPTDARRRRRLAPGATPMAGGAASPRPTSSDGHRQQCENFVRSLRGTEPLLVDGQEARKAVEIILALYASALSGKTVILPLSATPPRHAFSDP